MSFGIVTYNVLCRNYCNPKVYTAEYYDPLYIDFNYRYIKLWEKFNPFIEKRFIFCLQEVDVESSSYFQVDFKENNYDFFYHPYGSRASGNMGVAIAVPHDFKVFSVDKFRLSEGRKWPERKVGFFRGWYNYFWGAEEYKAWSRAKTCGNFLLTMGVEFQGKQVYISTIHMPCLYRYPDLMLTYLSLAVNRLDKISYYGPTVLAGDFNFTPDSQCYKAITTCKFEDEFGSFPPEDGMRPVFHLRMFSAVKTVHYAEPKWTNNSSSFGREKFTGTLDYIFKKDLFVTAASKGPAEDENALCPNKDEPSDHILLWAQFQLQ